MEILVITNFRTLHSEFSIVTAVKICGWNLTTLRGLRKSTMVASVVCSGMCKHAAGQRTANISRATPRQEKLATFASFQCIFRGIVLTTDKLHGLWWVWTEDGRFSLSAQNVVTLSIEGVKLAVINQKQQNDYYPSLRENLFLICPYYQQ